MNALTPLSSADGPETILAPDGAAFDWAAFEGYDQPVTARRDGWTAEKRRTFLEALAEGHSVTHACRIVGMSKRSAYSLRQSPRGASFALGWDAAQLLQRNSLADDLVDRALNGVTDTYTDDDGRITRRHRHDNRLAMAMLTRLDRAIDARAGAPGFAGARLIAQDFEAWLDLVGGEAPPARAALFLAAALGSDAAGEAGDDDLAPVRALARADRRLREAADAAGNAEEAARIAALDPACRAEWSAADWLLAESAGLIALAPPAEPGPPARDGNGESGHLRDPDNPDGEPVWWCSEDEAWRTSFPPPRDFYGDEDGEFGDPDYSRALTSAEEEAVEGPRSAALADRRTAEGQDRDVWFGFVTPAVPAPDAEPAPTGGAEQAGDPSVVVTTLQKREIPHGRNHAKAGGAKASRKTQHAPDDG